MQDSNIPYKFSTPWGSGAAGGYLTTIMPITTVGPAASQTLGFPPLDATPVGAGGSPPNIADMNGAVSYLSLWARWLQAGGAVPYDAAFQTNIGGYPKNAIIGSATTAKLFWISTVENNVTNPDVAGAGWQKWPFSQTGEILAGDIAANNIVKSFNTRHDDIILNSSDVITALGYTPVQQGTGVGQTSNLIKVGWSAGGKLKLTVDFSDFGDIALVGLPNVWTGFNNYSGSGAQLLLSGTGTFVSGQFFLNAPIPLGTNTGDIANANFVQNSILGGPSQTYQDLTGSRALYTTYTNTSGRAIFVQVIVGRNRAGLAGDIFLGFTVGGITVSQFWAVAASPQIGNASFIVPHNTTYSVQMLDGGTFDTFQWLELR